MKRPEHGTTQPATRDDGLSAHCDDTFAALPRADQRRWARVYIEGLLSGAGRRTISGMARGQRGRVDQSLQQFVSHSPWDWRPVRRALAAGLDPSLRPTALVIQEQAFLKDGRHSVGVDRQFVHSMGRVFNCQIGLTLSMADHRAALPVNWTLMLPPSWDDNDELRAKAYVPDEARNKPRWEHAVDLLTDFADGWNAPEAPVVVETHTDTEAAHLISALERLGYGYVVEVPATYKVVAEPRRRGPVGSAPVVPVGHLIDSLPEPTRYPVVLPTHDGGVFRSHFVFAPVRPVFATSSPRRPGVGTRGAVLADWPLNRAEPRGYWITNLADRSIDDLAVLIHMRSCAQNALETMQQKFGLCDFEGRSYRGWHHHVTLASAAYAFHLATS